MFCPKCGSNQGESKKFCTVCGTNLSIVSQALTGQLPQAQAPLNYAPPGITAYEIERHAEMRKGITMAVLGGGYILYKLISFIFSFPFNGWRSPFGFLSFIAFIVFAVGISKVVASRVTAPVTAMPTKLGNVPIAMTSPRTTAPQPVFSGTATAEPVAPHTNELEPVLRPATSVTEEDTRHLAH